MDREYGIGNVVFQDWRITKKIGQGAYGRVFEIEKNTYGIHARSLRSLIHRQTLRMLFRREWMKNR